MRMYSATYFRKSHLLACSGQHVIAALLAELMRWQDGQARKARLEHPNGEIPQERLWHYHTLQQLKESMGGLACVMTLRKAIQWLVNVGFLTLNKHPLRTADRTRFFFVTESAYRAVNEHEKAHTKSNISSAKNSTPCAKFSTTSLILYKEETNNNYLEGGEESIRTREVSPKRIGSPMGVGVVGVPSLSIENESSQTEPADTDGVVCDASGLPVGVVAKATKAEHLRETDREALATVCAVAQFSKTSANAPRTDSAGVPAIFHCLDSQGALAGVATPLPADGGPALADPSGGTTAVPCRQCGRMTEVSADVVAYGFPTYCDACERESQERAAGERAAKKRQARERDFRPLCPQALRREVCDGAPLGVAVRDTVIRGGGRNLQLWRLLRNAYVGHGRDVKSCSEAEFKYHRADYGWMREAECAAVLAVSDLGDGDLRDYEVVALRNLLRHRMEHGKTTLVSTGEAGGAGLAKRYGNGAAAQEVIGMLQKSFAKEVCHG